MYYYHFCRNDFRTRYTNEDIKIGETLYYSGELRVCQKGLHACPRIIDALLYAPGTILCIVELGAQVIQFQDKVVSNQRKVIAARNITRELVNFTYWCATRAKMHSEAADPIAAAYAADAAYSAAGAVASAGASAAADAAAVYADDAANAYTVAAAAVDVTNPTTYAIAAAYIAERNLQEEWLQEAIVLWDYKAETS